VTALAHEEIQELLGAYALHAVDPDEAAIVERHLEGCPRCRAEVEGHREVATLLGNSGGDAPDGLWDRIASQLEEAPPPMRLDLPGGPGSVIPLAPRRREKANRFVVAALGAAAALAIAVLGAQVVRQQDRIDDVQSALADSTLQAAANQAFSDPDAVTVHLRSSDGDVAGTAVVLPDGSGYLMAHELPGLANDRTYQLWGDTGRTSLVSLGVLGADPTTVAFQAGGDVSLLAITAEEAGGVTSSKNPPVMTGTFD
jgi:Anti-sigma-K factor rskA/Putative zinc-finger